MNTRTTQTIVHFSSAFQLPEFDAIQPAGDYRVDHDEEAIESASYIAWRRTGAFIHLPAIAAPDAGRSGTREATQQMVPIDPADLEAALRQDIAQAQAVLTRGSQPGNGADSRNA